MKIALVTDLHFGARNDNLKMASHQKKFYDEVEVINNLSLKINDGEFCVLVGPSGCGKSTLLRMIAGLEKITGGDIFINDLKVNDISAANRGLAMVFQSYALYPHMSVRQNLAFGLENLKMKKDEINKSDLPLATDSKKVFDIERLSRTTDNEEEEKETSFDTFKKKSKKRNHQ